MSHRERSPTGRPTARGPGTVDSALARASSRLAAGRPLEALGSIGPARSDPHALAIRGIALAQLGELERARRLLVAALRKFRRARDPLFAAKTIAALAEVDLAARDLASAARRLDGRALRALGDRASSSYVDVLRSRLLALLGRHEEALAVLRSAAWGPAAAFARAELLARLGRFEDAARAAERLDPENPLLAGEARRLARELRAPRFRLVRGGEVRAVSLVQIERLREPFVDAVRRRVGTLELSRRPAAFELLLALARGPVNARSLYGRTNESLEARLRVEVSRLRRELGLRIVHAGKEGYRVRGRLAVLLPETSPPEALLADGEAWPPRAIAAALGLSVRSVERSLAGDARFTGVGRGRARRFRLARLPGTGTATQLLLLARGGPG
ncbi:helix-turn-helix domain-containing protein [bacterium]|nr:helix-turn-helix domain-containing protein [bacterium]